MTRTVPLEKTYGAIMVHHLRSRGFETFHEVPHRSGRKPDIVAIHPDHGCQVFEVKPFANLDVIEQAHFWRGRANKSFVAVPLPKDRRQAEWFSQVCREFGVGVVDLSRGRADFLEFGAYDTIQGHDFTLTDEQKDSVAGTSDHEERFSPRRAFNELAAHTVEENPGGVELSELLHLSGCPFRRGPAGVSALRTAIRRGEIEGLELKSRGGKLWAFPAGTFFPMGSKNR